MFDEDPLVVALGFEEFRGSLPINKTGFGAAAEFAETQTVGPDFGIFILEEDIFEVDGGDTVIVFFKSAENVSVGTGEVTDIQQQGRFGDFTPEIVQLVLTFDGVAQVVVDGGGDVEFCTGFAEFFGAADKHIKFDISAAGTGDHPGVIFVESGSIKHALGDIAHTHSCKIHAEFAEFCGSCNGIGSISCFQSFDTVEADRFEIGKAIRQIVVTAEPDVHSIICNTIFHFYFPLYILG